MKISLNKERTHVTISQQCVIRPDQLHCLAPTTAQFAERIENLLKGFGIPAEVNRNNGLISVERGKLTVFPTTNATHYNWEETLPVSELKTKPMNLTPFFKMTEADRFWEEGGFDLAEPRER